MEQPVTARKRIRPAVAGAGAGNRLLQYVGTGYRWMMLVGITLGRYSAARLLEPFRGKGVWGTGLHRWARDVMAAGPYDCRIEGDARLERPCVVTANHQSIFDIALVAALIPPPLYFVSRSEILDVPVVGSVLRRGDHLIVRPGYKSDNEDVLRRARERLEQGAVIVVFPEGRRSEDGHVGRFRDGAFRLAQMARCPIVPLAIAGTRHALPKGTRTIRSCPVAAAFLPARSVLDTDVRGGLIRRTRDEVFERVRGLEAEIGAR